jgi:hypothetical protein
MSRALRLKRAVVVLGADERHVSREGDGSAEKIIVLPVRSAQLAVFPKTPVRKHE